MAAEHHKMKVLQGPRILRLGKEVALRYSFRETSSLQS